MLDQKKYIEETPVLQDVVDLRPTVWINHDKTEEANAWDDIPYTLEDIQDAADRLERFAPLLLEYFDDVQETNGIIESPLRKIPEMQGRIEENHKFNGDLYLKMDSHLAVAGSVKARGGIYEVLKHAEDLATEEGILSLDDDYSVLAEDKYRDFFSQYTIQVGSTGNLGLSIGIISATLGFKVIVHMSADAKKWKKDLLREKGATVVEYESDYSKAVEQGRAESDADPNSHFIDDENSVTLFLGYAVSALRLKNQLEEQNITVNENNPMFVYIPCGVGGAPGGIAFGLKKVFGGAAHVFFVEPTHIPSVLLGMATGLNGDVSVQDFKLDGVTEADGLACASPSGFVGEVMKTILSGIFTMEDYELFNYMRQLNNSEDIQIEPSACAAFEGPAKLYEYKASRDYLEKHNLDKSVMENSIHVAWATGGNLVPEEVMEENLNTYEEPDYLRGLEANK
jgi:D-serine dehydratase